MSEGTRKKRVTIALAAGLMVLVVLVLALRRQGPALQFVAVSREDLSQTISSNGKVEPISPVVAHAEFPAFVEKVAAKEGQMVRRGQLILTLDASDIRSQLAQAQADLLAAQTTERNARGGGPPEDIAQVNGDLLQVQADAASLERKQKALEKLVTQQAATQDEVAQNQLNLTKAQARQQALQQKKDAIQQRAAIDLQSAGLRVSQMQEQVQSLEEKVRSATVIAPADVTLYSLPVHAGDYVKVGDVLAEMADLRQVRVRAFVDEPDLGSLSPNQDVEVTWDAKPGQVWAGRTEQIPKQVVPHGIRSVGEVLCSVDNSKLELLPNINVEVRILIRERRDALALPRSTVLEDHGKHYVFVGDHGKLRRRDVSLGIASASMYEVLSGLSVNDRVALPGERTLRDGMEVRVAEDN
jgi:HlyD family secretion protein